MKYSVIIKEGWYTGPVKYKKGVEQELSKKELDELVYDFFCMSRKNDLKDLKENVHLIRRVSEIDFDEINKNRRKNRS